MYRTSPILAHGDAFDRKTSTPSNEFCFDKEEDIERVERLEVTATRLFQPWQEAGEEVIEVTEFNLSALCAQSMQWPFRLSPNRNREVIRDERAQSLESSGATRTSIAGMIELAAERLHDGRVQTHDAYFERLRDLRRDSRRTAKRRYHELSFPHTRYWKCAVENSYPSSILPRPTANLRNPAKTSAPGQSSSAKRGERDTMLSSPIILYDYPEIAPESPGDLFDGAEIDEILSLRIMTMTDEEKREMRQSDDRARKILERTESLPEEQLMKLHGALRGLRAVKERRRERMGMAAPGR